MRGYRRSSPTSAESLARQLAELHREHAVKAAARSTRPRHVTVEDVDEVAGLLGYRLLPKQKEILSCDKRIIVLMAGRRAGKSWLASLLGATTMLKAPGSVVMCLAPSELQARENMFARIMDWLDSLAPLYSLELEMRDTYGLRLRLSNSSLLIAGSDQQDPDRYRGWPIDLAILDEATWLQPITWNEVVLPALSERSGRAFLVSTPFSGTWFVTAYQQARERAHREAISLGYEGAEAERWVEENLDWAYFHFPSWENTFVYPQGERDPKIVQARRSTPDPYTFLQEYAAVPVPPREIVFPEWRPEVHVRSLEVPPDAPIHLAIDPAVQNIYAVLAIRDLGDVVYVNYEFTQRAVLTEEVIEYLSLQPWWKRVEEAVIDPDAEEARRKWVNHPRVHFPVRTFRKPKVQARHELTRYFLRDPVHFSSILDRHRQEVMELLGYRRSWSELSPEDKLEVETYALQRVSAEELREVARLYVHPRCTRTIEEFSRQRYKRRKIPEQNLPPQPEDAWNDCTDALGYWLWVHKRWYAVEEMRQPEEERLTPGQLMRRYLYGEPVGVR
jgi:hypothetical protein